MKMIILQGFTCFYSAGTSPLPLDGMPAGRIDFTHCHNLVISMFFFAVDFKDKTL